MMKKLLVSALAVLLSLLLCACGAEKAAVDFDIAAMSETMAYSFVYQMLNDPKTYLTKTVRVRGPLAISHFDQTDKDYYYVVIADTTACCSQGLEFRLPENAVLPADGETVEIVGTFSTYDELNVTYYCVDATDVISG